MSNVDSKDCPNFVGTHPHLGEECQRIGVVYVGGRRYCRVCERAMLRLIANSIQTTRVEVER